MPTSSRGARRRLALLGAGSLGLATLATGLTTAPALADPDPAISDLPYAQDWSDSSVLTTDDDWSGVPGVVGYRGDGLTGATGADPQTLLADGSGTPVDVNVDEAPTATVGGVLEVPSAGTVALQGSGTADAPHLVWHLDLTGEQAPTFSFTARDLDAGADDAVQQLAVHYRVGATGDFTNLPAGYVADATEAGSATKETAVSVALPEAVAGQGDVQVRVVTSNAAGHDELVGIDDVLITSDGTAPEPDPDPEPEPDPEPTAATIPEVQGTGAASPLVGEEVVTSGLVTAVPRFLYGFYLQTPGTGGSDRAEGSASDGLFVYFPQGSGQITVEPGDHVQVTGDVSEFAGATQVVSSEAEVEQLATPAEPVTAYAGAWPATDAAKESLEGMLFDPTDERFTVTNTFDTNRFGEVGLARGDSPLVQPTEVADAQDTAAVAAVVADNAARAIVLDDGSSTDYTRNGNLTPPYVSNTAPVRVGAPVRFTEPVVLTEGGSPSSPTYRFQPTVTVSGPDYTATSPAVFEDTRTAAPDEVGGDVSVASFNVLNYFTTLGDPDDDNVGDGGCTAFTDRDGDGNNIRGGCDPRGAWDPRDLARQQEKIVAAINTLDADVVGLMEIENSAALGEEADEATQSLVAALNAAAGEERWAANPSSTELPAISDQDVITNAIIYQPDAVERVGEARALGDQSAAGQAFDNAREPLGQVFVPAEGGEEVLVVVNHFKSKGSGEDDGTGQGNANPDRVAQATALRDWVPGVAEDTGTEAVLLLGDFNAYSQEDPMQVLYEAGYANTADSSATVEYSYSFRGLSGSLDHVLANGPAMEALTGVDTWNINSGESVALEYSRWNIHATDFHQAGPYRSSDHDPVKVGLDLVADAPGAAASEVSTTVRPKQPRAGKGRLVLKVDVTSEAGTPSGTVTMVATGGESVSDELRDSGRVVLRMRNPFDQAGTYPVTVTYAGDEATAPSEDVVEVRFRR